MIPRIVVMMIFSLWSQQALPFLRRSMLPRVSYLRTSSDTIFATASGPVVKSAVSVVRVSGPHSRLCMESLCGEKEVKPRTATVLNIHEPDTGERIDKAIVIWFPAPRSFTGEDCVEFHVHGSKAVTRGLFDALLSLNRPKELVHIRVAERGEFTRRAFDNGKMDLTEVEGLNDLLEAETFIQRKQALRQMEGHLRVKFEKWRQVLLRCLAHSEAVIDFGDDDRENDVSDAAMVALHPQLRELRAELQRHVESSRKGELVRDGIRIALVGPPNAGKSTLLNKLARRPAAIVSPIAGTTRDVVEVRLEIAGLPCIISDTAGLRAGSTDLIELEGMRRSREALHDAHLRVMVTDASDAESSESAHAEFSELRKSYPGTLIEVRNKADLMFQRPEPTRFNGEIPSILISCNTEQGLAELETTLADKIRSLTNLSNSEDAFLTRERHRRHVMRCLEHIDRFLRADLPMDLGAEELRLAATELGRVTGLVDVEEMLDIIFRDFCIGK